MYKNFITQATSNVYGMQFLNYVKIYNIRREVFKSEPTLS